MGSAPRPVIDLHGRLMRTWPRQHTPPPLPDADKGDSRRTQNAELFTWQTLYPIWATLTSSRLHRHRRTAPVQGARQPQITCTSWKLT